MAAAKMKEEIRMLGEMRTNGYVLTLVDTTQESEDLHVADVLVDHGHAAPDEDELKECEPRVTETPQHSTPSPIGPTPQPTSPFPPSGAPPTLPDIIAVQPIQNNENVSDKTESLSSDQFASSSMPTTDSRLFFFPFISSNFLRLFTYIYYIQLRQLSWKWSPIRQTIM